MFRRATFRLFDRVTVFGGGTMGGGIAQVAATAGVHVTVVDIDDGTCARSKRAVETSLMRVAKKKVIDGPDVEDKRASMVNDIVSRIAFTSSPEAAVRDADLVVEAIVENIEVKKKLWQSLDSVAKPSCVFATNTSSLSVRQQAKQTTRAAKFAGLHFFSPVPMMKLVEVVRCEETDDSTIDALCAFSTKIGKTPVVCQDTKGFVVNRLLIPAMMDAIRLVERGVASIEDVDVAMKLGAGHPMGPFTLADSIGIDVLKLVVDAWHEAEPENPLFLPSKLVDEKVAAGKLGRKTGEGFYKYK